MLLHHTQYASDTVRNNNLRDVDRRIVANSNRRIIPAKREAEAKCHVRFTSFTVDHPCDLPHSRNLVPNQFFLSLLLLRRRVLKYSWMTEDFDRGLMETDRHHWHILQPCELSTDCFKACRGLGGIILAFHVHTHIRVTKKKLSSSCPNTSLINQDFRSTNDVAGHTAVHQAHLNKLAILWTFMTLSHTWHCTQCSLSPNLACSFKVFTGKLDRSSTSLPKFPSSSIGSAVHRSRTSPQSSEYLSSMLEMLSLCGGKAGSTGFGGGGGCALRGFGGGGLSPAWDLGVELSPFSGGGRSA